MMSVKTSLKGYFDELELELELELDQIIVYSCIQTLTPFENWEKSYEAFDTIGQHFAIYQNDVSKQWTVIDAKKVIVMDYVR